MRISNVRKTQVNEDRVELHAAVHFDTHWVWGAEPFDLWYRFPIAYSEHLSEDNGDPFLAAMLLPAMAVGESIEMDLPVSEQLLESVDSISALVRCWEPRLKKPFLDVQTRSSTNGEQEGGRHAQFFSLGVDSSYSLLKNVRSGGAQSTHLLVVEGFDVYLWESDRFVPMLNQIQRVSSSLGREALPVTTNLRDVTDRMVDWVLLYHGAALASVALALGNYFRNVTIAASTTYKSITQLGSHPLLDPLWGTERLAIHHDGLEASRLDKIRYLAQSPLLLTSLRVCASGEVTDAYNCGRCLKCLRTMLGLYAAGVLDQCATLPKTINVDLLHDFTVRTESGLEYIIQVMNALGDSTHDAAIRAALTVTVERFRARQHT